MSLLPGRFYLDDFFNDFEPEKKVMNMNCDIYEKEGKYNIVMDIPGFDKRMLKLKLKMDILQYLLTRVKNMMTKINITLKEKDILVHSKENFILAM